MTHNIFSMHLLEEKKVIIHTCDPGPEFLNNSCSVCQGHFDPERANTLGQCLHAFHVICIVEHFLSRSMCP
jgi:hypothetical protein